MHDHPVQQIFSIILIAQYSSTTTNNPDVRHSHVKPFTTTFVYFLRELFWPAHQSSSIRHWRVQTTISLAGAAPALEMARQYFLNIPQFLILL